MNKFALPLMVSLLVGCASPTVDSVADTDTESVSPNLQVEGNDPISPQAEEVPAIASGTALAADGVEIAYDVRGSGDTTLLFVHCWSCDRSYWREQLDAFSEDYRVVSLDLAGHGASGTDREEWTVAGYAGDVLAVVEDLGLERVILIGHSMGGSVSVEAARLMPERTIGVACVDTLYNAEAEFEPTFAEELATRLEGDFVGVRSELLGQMFLPESDGEVQAWVARKGESAYAPAAIALMRDFATFDLAAAMAEVEVPIRCVNANALPPLIPETAVEINRKYADFDADIMDGVGHFLLLEQPEEFNALLRGAIAEIEG